MYGDDPVSVYLEEMGKVPPLTREQEMACVQHIRARDEHADLAMKDLVEQLLPLVVSIAQRNPSDHIHILDLIQTGNVALMTAARTFADSNADNFSAYATLFIEDAIVARKQLEPQINTDEH
jgi:RNA polymerase primary sigma factor